MALVIAASQIAFGMIAPTSTLIDAIRMFILGNRSHRLQCDFCQPNKGNLFR